MRPSYLNIESNIESVLSDGGNHNMKGKERLKFIPK